jgi:hypothetical protein
MRINEVSEKRGMIRAGVAINTQSVDQEQLLVDIFYDGSS